jgi:hypothetical protein
MHRDLKHWSSCLIFILSRFLSPQRAFFHMPFGYRLFSQWPHLSAFKPYIWNCLEQHWHVAPCVTDKISLPCQLQVKLTGTSLGFLSNLTCPTLKLADLRTRSMQILLTCCVWDTRSRFCVDNSTMQMLTAMHTHCPLNKRKSHSYEIFKGMAST